MADPAPQPSPLDQLLRIFTDVEAGEAGTALLMFFNLFLLLLGYYVLRVLREPLILASGAEVKSYAAAGRARAPQTRSTYPMPRTVAMRLSSKSRSSFSRSRCTSTSTTLVPGSNA